ncbi:MAG: hypothetical protein ACI3XF_04390 [Eubacteriales bacterium]
MKKTQWTALFADIRKTIISFISIALFVALGIGVFLGIKWNEPALAETSKQYYNKHSYHDLLLTFPYGVTEDDLAAVKELEGVADAEGSYSAHGQAYVGEERYVLVIQSLTERIDIADILEGTRPSAKNEIGIEQMFADATGPKVGDKLTIDTSNDGNSYLSVRTVFLPAFLAPVKEAARHFSSAYCGSWASACACCFGETKRFGR